MNSNLEVNLYKVSRFINTILPVLTLAFILAGIYVSFYFHYLSVTFIFLTAINFSYRHIQTRHALLRNFGIIGQLRYLLESVGPELRQYLFASDTEERPFNREERSEVYRKSKAMDSSFSFGSLGNFDGSEVKIVHSMFPAEKAALAPFEVVFGEERGIKNTHTINKHVMISAMSYGALSDHAVRALARGAKSAGITMNTGEGGYPRYHLMEGCDLIFQMGTAKFGVRNEDGSLNDELLRDVAALDPVRMVEIKFSQGAKPGKGGLLPKEKISDEIAELRNVPKDRDVVSPPSHIECTSPKNTVAFIRRVQEVTCLPVGVKMCIGSFSEFHSLIREMKRQGVYPDYIAVDGAEGGTGAAPKTFMDYVGLPLLPALFGVGNILNEENVRVKMKVIAGGKLINPGRQLVAMALGADAVYTARGFMMALGCIQAMQCGKNTCPVGITSHNPTLKNGLVISTKAERVKNYVDGLTHDFTELLAATGCRSTRELSLANLHIPHGSILGQLCKENTEEVSPGSTGENL